MRFFSLMAVLLVAAFGAGSLRAGFASRAEELYYRDDFAGAIVEATRALELDRSTTEPLSVIGAIYAHRRDFEALKKLVDSAKLHAPRCVEVALLECDLLFQSGKAGKARAVLEGALEGHPENPDLLLSLSVLLAATGDGRRARALLEGFLKRSSLDDAGDLLACAAAFILVPGGQGQGLKLLDRCRRLHGEGSQLVILEGLLLFRGGLYGKAVAALLRGLAMNPEKVNEVLLFSPLLSAVGQAGEACRLVKAAVRRFPKDRDARLLLERLESRVADERRLVKWRFGRVEAHVPPDLPPRTMAMVVSNVLLALEPTEEYFACHLGAVKVRVMATTGMDAPAYYNTLTDEILIARPLVDRGQGRATRLLSILRHEMGHLATRRVLQRAGISLHETGLPSWFVEGLAECSAGRTRSSRLSLPSEPLSDEDLLMGISLVSVDRPACRQAYAQACLMTSILVGHLPKTLRVRRVVRFAREFHRSKDLAVALRVAFRVRLSRFRTTVAQRLAHGSSLAR